MTYNPRLFAGELAPGDFRARISKPGQDASDPNLPRDQVDLDTAWPFAGNIHFVAKFRTVQVLANQNPVTLSPQTIVFPALPYVPVVKCFLCNSTGTQIIWLNPVSTNVVAGPGTITWETFADHVKVYWPGQMRFGYWIVAVVFKIPARDIGIVGGDPHPLARMMMGRRGSEYGLYASRPGFDVRWCAKSQMIFSSDDEMTVVNDTFSPPDGVPGTAGTPTDNTQTVVNFSYDWKGYNPIIFFFCTFRRTGGYSTYTLPPDKEINTFGPAYPAWGEILFGSPGNAQVRLRRIGSLAHIYISLIVIDEPLPHD
jgi:hypothetical protein